MIWDIETNVVIARADLVDGMFMEITKQIKDNKHLPQVDKILYLHKLMTSPAYQSPEETGRSGGKEQLQQETSDLSILALQKRTMSYKEFNDFTHSSEHMTKTILDNALIDGLDVEQKPVDFECIKCGLANIIERKYWRK